MANTVRYPVGIQTFSDIIKGNYLYVDKTDLVYRLVSETRYAFLSRPRRFGKSLLMSTLNSYFRGDKQLFKGLAIANLETEWLRFPVFRFDLSDDNFYNLSRTTEHIGNYLDNIEREYSLRSSGSIANRFRQLIRSAYEKFGSKVVVLIDEYDKPLLDCPDHGEHERIKGELRGFYSVLKASDEYVRFALLTGVTKFGKVSIFSGLNNLRDISLLPKYNSICGITEKEFQKYFRESVAEFSREHEMAEEESFGKFKELYDGYRFARSGENIYNPFSVLNAFNDGMLQDYWFASGSSSFLVKMVKSCPIPVDKLEGERRTGIQLSEITNLDKDLVPLLYQSGYLTIKDYDSFSEEYILGFPNGEVKRAFWKSLAVHFFEGTDAASTQKLNSYVEDLNQGKPEDFLLRMKSLFASIPSEHEPDKEIHFQNMMTIFIKILGFRVLTEVHSSIGRCDMQILTSSYIYIFEFKFNENPISAIKQIYEKGYAVQYESDSRIKFLIGVNFSGKTRTLDNWIIDRQER